MTAKHKFNAVKSSRNGFRFDSKKEARYYDELVLRQRAGEVAFFLMQVPFHLPGNVRYVVDFQVFLSDGTIEFVDVKGMQTEMFKTKKKLVESIYPIEIKVV